ncbi:MAG: hypothetical protein ABSA57_07920 [Candidatus Acidiferrales bacterium]|jgi:hypothetical protein
MGRISFQKRQKEMKRQEKQQMKAQRRAERKIAKNNEAEGGGAQPGGSNEIDLNDPDFAVSPGWETQEPI